MDETIDWLARALIQIREPDPRAAPATAAQDLSTALGFFGPPTAFVDALTARVFELSRGTMVLTPGSEAEFQEPFARRTQAVFLVLSARRRLVLAPDANRPVQFDE